MYLLTHYASYRYPKKIPASRIWYSEAGCGCAGAPWLTPTLCIPNHSVAVNHSFLENGAGGIRYMSAPPTTTPSADTARKEEVHRVKFKHPRKVQQLPVLLRTHQAGTSKHPWEEDTSNGDPSTRRKGLRRHRSLQRRRPLLLKSSDETHMLSLCGRTSQRSAPPFIPSQASHSIPFDQNSLVLKPTAKVHRDPRANILKLNAARMQGIPVAGALVVRNAAEEERSTASSHLVSAATTADPPSLAPLVAAATMSLVPLASMAGTLSMMSAATTSLAPSASISNQLGALKRRGKGPWQLTWYACPHSVAVVSLSIAVFRQMMLQNHPFDTRNLDTISLESYQSAVSSLKDSADKG
jgi:hypothetical protein